MGMDTGIRGHASMETQNPRSRAHRRTACIDTLARAKRGVVDDALLAACRGAAEQQMPHAIAHQDLLGRMMESEDGALDGLAAARQDLWRLAHMAIYLRDGTTILRESGVSLDVKSVGSLAGRLRRRFRKALIAYAKASLRTEEPKGRRVVAARDAALAEIGERAASEADRLSEIEADGSPTQGAIRVGVTKALLDLSLDWQRGESGPTNTVP
jgi:hypothetical protein